MIRLNNRLQVKDLLIGSIVNAYYQETEERNLEERTNQTNLRERQEEERQANLLQTKLRRLEMETKNKNEEIKHKDEEFREKDFQRWEEHRSYSILQGDLDERQKMLSDLTHQWAVLRMAGYEVPRVQYRAQEVFRAALVYGLPAAAKALMGEWGGNLRSVMNDVDVLLNAADLGWSNTIQFLLDNGTDGNLSSEDGSTALHMAARQGHEPVVRLLLNRHANPQARDRQGKTPQELASQYQNWAVLHLLESSPALRRAGEAS